MEIEQLKETLIKYLEYPSADGNLERRKLRKELREILGLEIPKNWI